MSYRIHRTQEGLTQYPLHTHKQYEIMLYLEGEGCLRTEQGDVPFRRGTVVIVPPNVRHGSVSETGFRNISVEGDFEKYLHVDTVQVLSDNETEEGRSLAGMIYDNRYGNRAYLASLCVAYVCFLTQRLEIEGTVRQRVRRILSEISENAFDSEIDLSAILARSGYSEDYVRACFKRITGKTPHECLTEIRIRHACFLIDVYQNDLSLSEIAEACGYVDYVYFSKKFKAVVGTSPREYRGR